MDNISIKTAELFADENMNTYTNFISEMNKVISKFQGKSPTIFYHIEEDKIRRVASSNMPVEFKEKLTKAYREQSDFFSQQIGMFTRAIARAEERKVTTEGVKVTFSAKPVTLVKKVESAPVATPAAPVIPAVPVIPEVPVTPVKADSAPAVPVIPVKADSAPDVSPPADTEIHAIAKAPVKAEAAIVPAVSAFFMKAASAPSPAASAPSPAASAPSPAASSKKPPKCIYVKHDGVINIITPSPHPRSKSPAVVSTSQEVPAITPSPVLPESDEAPNFQSVVDMLENSEFQAILASFQPKTQ